MFIADVVATRNNLHYLQGMLLLVQVGGAGDNGLGTVRAISDGGGTVSQSGGGAVGKSGGGTVGQSRGSAVGDSGGGGVGNGGGGIDGSLHGDLGVKKKSCQKCHEIM